MYWIILLVWGACSQTIDLQATPYRFTSYNLARNNKVNQKYVNGTFILDFLSNPDYLYYHIELRIVGQPSKLALLVQQQSAPTFDKNGSPQADDMDYNGFALKKSYQHLLLDFSTGFPSRSIYVSVLITKPLQYTLSITGSNEPLCAQGCSNHGVCVDGECQCDEKWIDEDCSVAAMSSIKVNQPFKVGLKDMSPVYFYYQHDNRQKALELQISTISVFGLQVYILIPDMIYLPTANYYDKLVIIDVDNPYSLVLQFQSDGKTDKDEFDEYDDENDHHDDDRLLQVANSNQPARLIIAVQQQIQEEGVTVTFSLQKYVGEEPMDATIIIIIVLASLAGLLFIICLIITIKRKTLQNQLNRAAAPIVGAQVVQSGLNQRNFDQYIPIVQLEQIAHVNNDSCTVCLDSFSNNRQIRLTPCNHAFHSECIQAWLKSHDDCPNCRFSLKLADLQKMEEEKPNTNLIQVRPTIRTR